MKYVIVGALIAFCCPASAAALACSVHAPSGTDVGHFQAQTKVTLATARATALALIGVRAAQVVEGELEIEGGCLVYSFDIRVPNKAGIEEVMVDPGNGAVLSRSHETPTQMAAERASEIEARMQRGAHAAR